VDIQRLLPSAGIRMIGAWCFLDYYGPTAQSSAMNIAAHPHTGLQTVSWLFSGQIEHNDSTGSRSLITPGQLNLMTAGKGIAHSEISSDQNQVLHGVQFWIALPDDQRNQEPHFEHHQQLPIIELGQLHMRLFMGNYQGINSPAVTYSKLIGAEISGPAGRHNLALATNFEHGIMAITNPVLVDESVIRDSQLLYIASGKGEIEIKSDLPFRLILIGGQALGEDLVMWWNFVGRSHEEIIQMRQNWEDGKYPRVADQIGGRIPAPQMPGLRLKPRSARNK
jgi:redox-sensitive bicupin YhaK (pirin superfamily)